MTETRNRFGWNPGDIEVVSIRDRIKALWLDLESKDRRVRDPEYWGLPYGTPILPGMKPRGAEKPRKRPARAPGPKNVSKAPAKRSAGRTGGSGKTVADKPATIATPKPKGTARVRAQQMHERDDVWANGVQRAWGPANDDQAAVRANVAKRDYTIETVTPAELDAARKTAIDRAKNKTPKPSEWDVRDNKRINALGGAGSTGILDTLRGNHAQRRGNSWAVYVAYGGWDAKKNKDRGYVPCVGCGMKMTWHDDPKRSKFPKFEQDKIVVSGDGGQYNPQNIVPMCAGCNNQRGPKRFWEAPVFKNGKPKWYNDKDYQKWLKLKTPGPQEIPPRKKGESEKDWVTRVEKKLPLLKELRRPDNSKGIYGRPPKEVPAVPMPPDMKGYLFMNEFKSSVGQRAFDLEIKAGVVDGDRIRAKQMNWDGRNPDLETPENQDEMVGRYVKREVDSAFGSYTQHLLVKDDGSYRFVEPDSIELIASGSNGEDVPEAKSEVKRLGKEVEKDSTSGFRDPDLTDYWTRGAGLAKWAKNAHPYTALVRALRAKGVPAKHVHGLAARYFKKVFGIWPGQRKKG